MLSTLFRTAAAVLILTIIPTAVFSASFAEITDSIRDRNFDRALQLLSGIKDTGFLLFLKGNVLLEKKHYSEAEKTYTRMIRKFPDSRWRFKAEFRRAEAFVQMKQFHKAVAGYTAALKRLSSRTRRIKMAGRYLDLGRKTVKPEKKGETVSSWKHRKASGYFLKALDLGSLPSKMETRLKLLRAVSLFKAGRYYEKKQALKILEKLEESALKKHPVFRQKTVFYLAGCYSALYRRWEARSRYYRLLRTGKGGDFPVKAGIALLKMYRFDKNVSSLSIYRTGSSVVAIMKKRFPSHKLTRKARAWRARALLALGKAEDAITVIRAFLRDYPDKEESPDLAFALGEKLLASGRPGKALARFREYLSRYPASRHWRTVQKRIVDIAYQEGQTSFARKQYAKAAASWAGFQKKYPLDSRVIRAARMQGEACSKLKKYAEAVSIWKKLASKYPGTTEANRALLSAATLLADKLENFKEAFKLLKKVSGYTYRRIARMKKTVITRPDLVLKTEKIYTSREKAGIKVRLRNIKELKVRIYDLNLNAYFRKTHSISSMDKLDIDLIKPDRELTFKVKDYKKYRLYNKFISLDNLGPGSYLIHCRSKTLKATTLLIRSDLGLLVKSSGRQLFVMTSDLKSGKPVSGVNLLFSNGKEVFLTGKTGKSGLFIRDYSKKRPSCTLSVFAWRGRHAASNKPGYTRTFSGIRTSTLVHFSTDRPAYRPGDRIRFRCTIRSRKDGLLSVPSGKYIVSFRGPSGLALFSKKISISKYGTWNGSFLLDTALKNGTGEFRLQNAKELLIGRQQIPILRYTPKQTETMIRTDKTAYFPGEKVKLTLRFSRLFGAAASGDYFYMRINREQWKRYRTDKHGQKTLILDTTRYAQQGSFTVRVRPSWENSVTTRKIPILEQAYSLKASSVRRIYMAGEKVKVAVSVTALKGISKRKKLAWKADRLIPVPGGSPLRENAASGTIRTSSKGKGQIRFTAKKSGIYIITVEGRSRTGGLVNAATSITIPDTKSKIKLFFLHEKKELNAGSAYTLPVYSRTASRYALLTVEKDRVLHSRILHIRKGKNEIRIAVRKSFGPNCRISLTIAARDGLHTTGAGFRIKENIALKIKGLPAGIKKPGSRVTLTLDTRNQNRIRTDSEVFFAVVDDSLFSATGSSLKKIEKIFRNPVFFRKMATTAFTPFRYKAKTSGRNSALITALKLSRNMDKSKSGYRRSRTRNGLGYADDGVRSGMNKRPALLDQIKQSSPRKNQDRRLRSIVTKEEQKRSELRRRRAEMVLAGLAFFKANLITGSDGKARVSFTLPAKAARWRIIAVAVDKKGAVGSIQKTFRSGYSTHIRILTPGSMLRGDSLTAKAVIYNNSGRRKKGRLRIRVSGVRRTRTISRSYTLGKNGSREFHFRLHPAASAPLTVSVRADGRTLRKKIKVTEPGTLMTSGTGGTADRTSRLQIDCSMKPGAKKGGLSVNISRPIDSLFSTWAPGPGAGSLTGTVNRLLRLTGRYRYLKRQASWTRYKRESLQVEIADLLVHLRILQKQNWRGTAPGTALLAYTYFAASTVKKLGIDTRGFLYLFRGLERTLKYRFKQSSTAQKAMILFALSWNGKAEYAYLNRLYRMRTSLGVRETALLTTALVNADRRVMASECVQGITSRLRFDNGRAWIPEERTGKYGWFSGNIDRTALGALALLKAAPASKHLPKLIRHLLHRRTLTRSTPAGGLVPFILSGYLKPLENSRGYAVSVRVNGRRWKSTNAKGRLSLYIPQSKLKNGRNQVVLTLSGKGRYIYSVTHSQKLAGYIADAGSFPGKVQVNYEYPLYRIEDTVFKRGYSIIRGKYNKIKNELSRIPVGTAFTIRTRLRLRKSPARSFVVVQTLPPGCRFLSTVNNSAVEHYEQNGRELRFWVRRRYSGNDIRFSYSIVAELPGKTVIPPCTAFPLNRPDSRWNGRAKTMQFLSKGGIFTGKYRFTPDERYRLGQYRFEKKQYGKAWPLLIHCLDKYKLRRTVYIATAKSLLHIALRQKRMKQVIRMFEILKERDPEMTIPLEDAATVSAAYAGIGEHERAYQILAGILEARFLQESAVSGAYQDEKRIKDSVRFMEKLFLQYPDQSTQRVTYYSLAHQLYSRASESKDPELKKLKITRKYLFSKAQTLFERYMLLYPMDRKTPEAAFSILSLLVEQEKYKPVIQRASRYAAIHSKSAYLDAFKYLSAYSLFFEKQFKKAAGYCDSIARDRFPTKSGGMDTSRYKHIAVHMLGKIHHSLQQFKKAIAAYSKVETKFPDAARAIRFLKERHLSIPEVTTINTGDQPKLKIRFKGVKKISMTLYKVDFLLLCLKEKDLSRITRINLAGIKPYLTRSVQLAADHPYLGREKSVTVPAKDRGAYLVVLKANGIETSGMILKSDLRMDVLGLATKGIARVSIRNTTTGRVVPGTVVNFLTSGSSSIKTVKTDLRGMAETGGLSGIPTIVGIHKGHYCFFRGNRTFRTRTWGGRVFDSTSYKKKALRKLFQQRRSIQKDNESIWNKNIKQDKKGLILKKAY